MKNFLKKFNTLFSVKILMLAFAGVPLTSQASEKANGDKVEGWIIKKDKDGRTIKIPKKQTFKFGGSNVEGAVTRPAESALASRTSPQTSSLIPIRRSFRKEFMDTAGLTQNQNGTAEGNR